MIEKNGHKEMHLEVEWKVREDGFKPTNSLIESKIILEHAPKFLIGFFQKKTKLIFDENEMNV